MTNPFPKSKPIDWGELEPGDKVLIAGDVMRDARGDTIISLSLNATLKSHDQVGLSGHVIEAPKPIAVGDKVQTIGLVGFWYILAINDHSAWVKGCAPKNEGIYKTLPVNALERIEP
jgi:hypothetical protein